MVLITYVLSINILCQCLFLNDFICATYYLELICTLLHFGGKNFTFDQNLNQNTLLIPGNCVFTVAPCKHRSEKNQKDYALR